MKNLGLCWFKCTVLTAVLLAAGCGADGGSDVDGGTSSPDARTTIPTVLSNTPANGAVGISIIGLASATFREPMNGSTLDATTFRLTTGMPVVAVAGTVTYADSTATFWPIAYLSNDTTFTATITTAVTSASGVALAQEHVWTFTSGTTVGEEVPVNLGTAGNFAILAKSGISTVPTSAITGDIGVSPAAASYITGFSLTADSSNTFATAPQVVGKIYASNYAPPTPAMMTTAISDMELALVMASARAPGVTELGAGNIGGMTLQPGIYKWGTGLLIPTDVTLTGSATDVWIFQIAKDLTFSSHARIVLAGGALPKNVFWQVSGLVDLDTAAHCQGTVISMTSITLRTGASINGRLLAQTAIDIDGSTVVKL
jgi:hypothetical protein